MRVFLRAAVGLGVLLAAAFGVTRILMGRSDAQGPCAATVAPGGDVGRAVSDAPAGATICLAAGTHRPFSLSFIRPGITLRGEGAGATVVQAGERDGIDAVNVERLTLAGLTVRGGDPAGIYASKARDVVLRGVRVEGANIALHADGGSSLSLDDVTVVGSRDFGLLLRRGAGLSARGLRVFDHRGIGIGAVEGPGAVSLADSEVARAAGQGRGENLVFNGWERFTLTNVTVRGGDPAGIYVAKAKELSLRDVRIEGAHFGLHLDENTVATADELSITGSTGVGLLVQKGGTITGRAVHVLDTFGTGVSAINGAGLLTLRDSEIGRAAAAGLFAGVAGCQDLPPASLDVPACFSKDLQGQISTERVMLEGVAIYETTGPCLVFFPGVRAEVRGSSLRRCELTGLFAWGATADVHGTTFEDNAEHALEYRAYPDPRGVVLRGASGTIEDSVIRSTRPLEGAVLGAAGPGPVLGGGVLAQGAQVDVRRTEVSGNRDIGVAYINSSIGEVTNSRILGNGNTGLCVQAGSRVVVRDTTLTGNRNDNPNACGGLAGEGRLATR